MVPDQSREPATAWSPVWHASDWAAEPGCTSYALVMHSLNGPTKVDIFRAGFNLLITCQTYFVFTFILDRMIPFRPWQAKEPLANNYAKNKKLNIWSTEMSRKPPANRVKNLCPTKYFHIHKWIITGRHFMHVVPHNGLQLLDLLKLLDRSEPAHVLVIKVTRLTNKHTVMQSDLSLWSMPVTAGTK